MLPANATSSGKEFILRGISLIYEINKKGPTMHTCGTPCFFNVSHQRKNFGLH
jgi:hypothetical protein